jgi:hypothetical protein
MDNDRYIQSCKDPNDPKQTKWFYHGNYLANLLIILTLEVSR